MFEEQDFKPKLETELSNQLMNIARGPQIDLFTYDPGYATNAQTFLGFSNREEFYPYIKSGPLILKEVYMILKNKREVFSSEVKFENDYVIITNVNYIPILFNRKFFNNLNEREHIAISLHEIGHHTAWGNFILRGLSILPAYLISFIGRFMVPPTMILSGVVGLVPIYISILSSIIGMMIGPMYSKFIVEHAEVNADNFAIKLGYGKDLAHTLQVWRDSTSNEKAFEIFSRYILGLTTHPEISSRIERLANDPTGPMNKDPLLIEFANRCKKIIESLQKNENSYDIIKSDNINNNEKKDIMQEMKNNIIILKEDLNRMKLLIG